MAITILVVGFCLILFMYLFESGIIVKSSKRAVKFIGTDRAKKASYVACTGSVTRILKVKETKLYEFSLYLEQEKGTVEVILNDWNDHPLMILDHKTTNETIMLDSAARYKLVFWFRNATGCYELDWE